MFETILPVDRQGWSADDERLALALSAGASNQRDRAALALLFREPDRSLFKADLRRFVRTNPAPLVLTWVDWSGLAAEVDDCGLSGEATYSLPLVMLACAIADDDCLVRLGAVLSCLDEPQLQLFLDAAAFVVGAR